jgi:hypothetical protein
LPDRAYARAKSSQRTVQKKNLTQSRKAAKLKPIRNSRKKAQKTQKQKYGIAAKEPKDRKEKNSAPADLCDLSLFCLQ